MSDKKTARLILEDGTQFEGYSFGAETSVSGEVVFNTAMTGYPESLTDPSYSGQILVSTYPLIGNYGVPQFTEQDGLLRFFESDRIHIRALVVSDYSFEHSHWTRARASDSGSRTTACRAFGAWTRAGSRRSSASGASCSASL